MLNFIIDKSLRGTNIIFRNYKEIIKCLIYFSNKLGIFMIIT